MGTFFRQKGLCEEIIKDTDKVKTLQHKESAIFNVKHHENLKFNTQTSANLLCLIIAFISILIILFL